MTCTHTTESDVSSREQDRSERRQSPRFYFGPDHPLTAFVGYDYWPARIRDISSEGASLLLSRRLEVGGQVTIRFPSLGAKCVRVFHILRVTQFAEQCWVVGGMFGVQLTPDELDGAVGLGETAAST